MKISNPDKLPDALVRVAMNDTYSRGEADISVTSLIDAPRLHIMAQAYTGDMAPTIDLSKRLWPLLGTAFHKMMDEGEDRDVIKEERLFMSVEGWVVSGAIDRQVKRNRSVDIEDFKVTSVYTYVGAKNGDRDSWEKQLNMYAALAEANGRKVRNLYVLALLRDWRPMEAKTKAGYPQSPIMRLKIEKWSKKKRTSYMADRVQLHQAAQDIWDTEGAIVECSDEDRWATPGQWAVRRPGSKRAVRLLPSYKEAEVYVASGGGPLVIQKRPGANRRCEGYCDYADLCGQWREIQENAVVDEVMDKMEGS